LVLVTFTQWVIFENALLGNGKKLPFLKTEKDQKLENSKV